jgi:hypothetical protein
MKKLSVDELSGGYFRAPDFIFDPRLPLAPNSRLIFCCLCRRADEDGLSFPSLKRICKDTGIKSNNTVLKALKGLYELGIVKKLSPLRKRGSNRYILSEAVLKIIYSNSKQSTVINNKTDPSNIEHQYANDEHPYSNIELEHTHILSTKEYPDKENPIKERIEDLNENDLNKRVKDHMKSLTPNDRQLFDSRVYAGLPFSYPKPKPNSPEMNRLRYKYLLEDE